MKNNFMELRQMTYIPVLRLKEKLHEGELEWDEEFSRDKKFYTVEDLLDVVQMSETELQKALERMPVITLNGYVRMLSAEFHDRLLTMLVDCLDDDEEPGIILESVGLECLKEALKKHLPDKNIPVEAVHWLVETYCDVVKENGTETYHINEKAICRAKISQLLRAAVKFEYNIFEKTLQQILPLGVEFKDEYLEGLAFVDDELTSGRTIRYLNVEDLPEEPIKRLELLFSLRQRWEESAIQQYLSDLCPTKRHLNELLVNCCRQVTTVNGEKLLVGLKEMLL
uniref:Sister chromatid cohesion protein DCC1 n=1 Tax=Elaeophora elaphi TaxID=1147741 RepID=A0A0R3RJF0_9BILA